MTFKSFLINHFDAMFKRFDSLEAKLEYAQSAGAEMQTYDTNKTAQILGVSTRTLSKYRKTKLIGFVQIGRKVGFTREHIDSFLAKHSVGIKNNKY